MQYNHIMVRFGELSTKGKNKKDFITMLARNIRHALKQYSNLEYFVRHDHIYIGLNGVNEKPILERLKDISGIHSFSLVLKTNPELENLKQICLELVSQEKGTTFKVKARRADKSYPIISDEINRFIAGHILANIDLKVDVHHPDILLSIDIRHDACYIFTQTIYGAGGYPLGVGGKIMMMLSGGIDSPVACYLMMRRGVMIECIHFAAPPYTSAAVIDKLKDICQQLNYYQPEIRLHIVPFTKIQEAIYAHGDESYAITIMRRMMYRLSAALAQKRKCLALGNGESIGQVASQTLHSMSVINKVTNMPIIRPLATTDKLEIMNIARKIKTYDISIRPFEDCCTIFTPKNPKTAPHFDEVEKIEEMFDFQTLIEESLQTTEVLVIKTSEEIEKYL